ncbi:MAG: sigma factor, partial [Spirochaetales bacterium]|nr:sigma factor [Spirochaetales bacterium]
MLSDEKTSAELKSNDDADFRKIYDATFAILFKVAVKVVLDEEAAEDLVHDSYIKAREKQMVFPTMNDATFWLIRVVKNASLNYAKRKIREANAYHKALYEGRQHKRTGRESLDCAIMLNELNSMGVENIITFDAHDPRVQNAIPMGGFETVQPTYQFIKVLLTHVPDLQ